MSAPFVEITFEDHGGLRRIADHVAAYGLLEDIDLSPLIPEAVEILRRGRERMTLAGTDSDGNPLAPIVAETVERRRRRGDGDGPPLAPNYAGSRVNRNVLHAVTATPNALLAQVSWIGADWLHVHATEGVGRYRTIRDVILPDPETRAELADLVWDYIGQRIRDAQQGAQPGFWSRARSRAGSVFSRLFGRG